MDYPIWIIVIGFVIILTSLVFMIFEYSNITKIIPGGVGTKCSEITKCGTGLVCSNQVCKIPDEGSCIRKTHGCMSGSVCFNGKCLPSVVTVGDNYPNQSRTMVTKKDLVSEPTDCEEYDSDGWA